MNKAFARVDLAQRRARGIRRSPFDIPIDALCREIEIGRRKMLDNVTGFEFKAEIQGGRLKRTPIDMNHRLRPGGTDECKDQERGANA